MNILIIEDNGYKYKDIKEALNKIFINPVINWEKSKTSGLYAIEKHNFKTSGLIPYDLIICDNYLPIFDDERTLKECALDIINEIKENYELNNLKIIVCSAGNLEPNNYDFFIQYDSNILLDEEFLKILQKMNDIKRKTLKK